MVSSCVVITQPWAQTLDWLMNDTYNFTKIPCKNAYTLNAKEQNSKKKSGLVLLWYYFFKFMLPTLTHLIYYNKALMKPTIIPWSKSLITIGKQNQHSINT